MLWRRLPAGGEPLKFKRMWNWLFLKLFVTSNGGYLAQTAISEWSEAIGVSRFYSCPTVTILFFYIGLSFEIDAHALMNERGKGRDTENYDETSKMGPPFFYPLLLFCPTFFCCPFGQLVVIEVGSVRRGTSEGA